MIKINVFKDLFIINYIIIKVFQDTTELSHNTHDFRTSYEKNIFYEKNN